MTSPTLTAEEAATELGRSADWFYGQWRALCKTKRMPHPLHTAAPLVWSRAQFYAWLDRDLTPAQRLAAQAYRAALAAAEAEVGLAADPLTDAKRTLDHRYVKDLS